MNFEVHDEPEEHDKDTLLASYRRRWRGPVALTADDFLIIFQAVDKSNTLESILERLKQGEWRYPTAFAKAFRRPANWAQSYKYYLKRTNQISNYDEFFNLFPARRPA